MILRAAGPSDVAAAVKFAVEHIVPLSVRGGGHSIAGYSVVDGALVIDMTGMRGVTIHSETRLARPGGRSQHRPCRPRQRTRSRTFHRRHRDCRPRRLVTGGGIGYFVRTYGLAADRLRSAKVVTASGDIITKSVTGHPDLFWAIRGGGGNFGIVVEFEFELVPVRDVYAGAIILPISRDVVRGYLDYSGTGREARRRSTAISRYRWRCSRTGSCW